MAGSYQTLDTNIITLRQIYARTPANGFITTDYILASRQNGVADWVSISSIYPISSINSIITPNGSRFDADPYNSLLNVSTAGVGGLLSVYVQPSTNILMLSNTPTNVGVALQPVPAVSKAAADILPSPQYITYSTSQTTLKFLGVGDILLSTVTESQAIFISISSFTSQNYSSLTAEAYAWRPTLSTTVSTIEGYATFISSMPFVTSNWNWASVVGSNLSLSTAEAYPSYSTGDVYIRGVTFTMSDYLRYIRGNSTTKLFLEMNPSYFLPRMFLGTSADANLIKSVSSYIQYQSLSTLSTTILSNATNVSYITSQNSNVYTSNVFTNQVKLEIPSGTVLSNAAVDGPNGGYYTLYHRIQGGMASLVSDGYCGLTVGPRGGFSNEFPLYDNRQGQTNTVFMHVYNN
jgi:hypothetical protein